MTKPSNADKAQAAHDRLVAEIDTLVSGDDWKAALETAARFHTYSFGNTILIARQAADRGFEATRVAGYRAWQALGRQVRKGETGLTILAPNRRKIEDDETGETRYVVVGFHGTAVFDVSQTDGDPVADVHDFVGLLDGDAPTPEAIRRLVDVLAVAGFATTFAPITGSANGYTNYTTRTVTVRDDVSPAQQFKTLVHETAHVLLHDPNGNGRPDCRGTVEVEAESVAFVVSSALGLDTSTYSFGYVAGWASRTGETDAAKVVAETGKRAVKTAKTILEALDPKEETR